MPSVKFGDRLHDCGESESLLDALLRGGEAIPHSCKAGSCGSCMMRAVDGVVPEKAQAGLKETWKARGYFLACVCQPQSDISVAAVADDVEVPASIVTVGDLGADVMRVCLRTRNEFLFRAGQYISLRVGGGLARSYSVASLPEDGILELHVRIYPNGRMGQWLKNEAKPGVAVSLIGPSGECFYVGGREQQPLLLAGTGTGLAPLYGILRDALRSGHSGPIHLFHGALRQSGIYLADELKRLASAHPNFAYTPTLFEQDGAIDRFVLSRLPKLNGWRAFLCGDPATVQTMKKRFFLAGIAMPDIYADAFLPSA